MGLCYSDRVQNGISGDYLERSEICESDRIMEKRWVQDAKRRKQIAKNTSKNISQNTRSCKMLYYARKDTWFDEYTSVELLIDFRPEADYGLFSGYHNGEIDEETCSFDEFNIYEDNLNDEEKVK